MTEPGPFPPPIAAPPPSAPPPPAAPPVAPHPVAPSSPTLPPPTGAPIGSAASIPIPPPPRRRRWLIPVIVGGSILFVALIAGVSVVAVQLATWVSEMPTVTSPLDGGDPQEPAPLTEPDDLVEGEPGDPVADDPLDCSTCFAADDLADLRVPGGAYVRLGLPVEEGKAFELPMFSDQRDYVEWWEDDGGTPDSCYFTYTQPPLLFTPEVGGEGTSDVVRYAPAHYDADGVYSIVEASRIFLTSSQAAAHMVQLEAALPGCTEISMPAAGYAAKVTLAPAFEVPASVAAYGWVETAGYGRYYAADVLRGNIVTRITLYSDSGGPSEQEFRAFVEDYAAALEGLEP